MPVILICRPWISRLLAIVVRLASFGFLNLDAPKVGRLPQLGGLRRIFLSWKARYHGRRDGRVGIPRQEEALAPPEIWKLKQQGDGVVRNLAATWSAIDARLKGESDATQSSVDTIEKILDSLNHDLVELTQRFDDRRNDLAEMRKGDEEREAEDRWRIPTWFYVTALAIIFIGEFPLNAVAFNLFGENRWPTYAMTAGLAAVLVFCAHGLGILWRQRTLNDRELVVTWLLALLPIAVIVAIAIVRESYLEALNRTGGGLAILSPMMGIVIFLTMNLVIYLAAFALSFLHHDPVNALIERAQRDVRRAGRAVASKEREIRRTKLLQRWLIAKLALWHAARQTAHGYAAYQGKRHKDFFEMFMQAYWASNRLAAERRLRGERRRGRRRGEDAETATSASTSPKTPRQLPEVKLPEQFVEDVSQPLEDGVRAAADGKRRPESSTSPAP